MDSDRAGGDEIMKPMLQSFGVKRYGWPIFVYPTRRCNYRCSYCFTDSGPQRQLGSDIIELWQRFCDEAAAIGVPEIRLSGGEPLVLPSLNAMCEAIVSHGMRYTITTNGALLDRHLSWLAALPPETLWISFHREYRSIESFMEVVGVAVQALPRVGLNIFVNDWDDAFATAGAARIKLLTQSAIGRGQISAGKELDLSALVGTVDVRIESQQREHGIGSCVLRERPLLSIDASGRAYACCVTLGTAEAEVGDFRAESLATIVDRALSPFEHLPCARLLPDVAKGLDGCPVRLYAI